jgi:hypothetical protein
MTRRLLPLVPLLALIITVAAVVPGCGGGGAPQNIFVEGFFWCWAPQLLPFIGNNNHAPVSVQQVEGPDEPIALTDTYIVFGGQGDCYMQGEAAEQTDLADVQTAWWSDSFELEGTWYQDGNIVYATLGGAASTANGWGNDFAELTLEFSNDEQANGQLILGLGWKEYEGAIAINESDVPLG